MAIDYDKIMSLKSNDVEYSYTDNDTMLYALGVGFGRDPLNRDELDFVYEKDLKTIPSMATVIAWGAGHMRDSGMNYLMVVHGEQRLKIYEPLPVAANILVDSRVTHVIDKGVDKGALLVTEGDIKEKQTGKLLCTLGGTTFARGDGGFGGPKDGSPEPHQIPDRKPDIISELDTTPDQALLYRLSGDRNPLHSDLDVAEAAGFPRPILHGLCSYGTACRSIIKDVCKYDSSLIKQFDVRFSSPVFPGEKISTEIWIDGSDISFRSWVKERNVMVINNGKCVLRD